MKKEKLFKAICEWYNYDFTIEEDGVIKETDGADGYFEHENINKALKEWLQTLKQSNETHLKEEGKEYYLWSKEEIEFIESL